MGMSPHVRELRRLVGNGLLLLPSASVLPRDEAGRRLLVRQSDFGHWASCGGAIEVDERPADAAVREAREEAGVDVELCGILGVVGGPEFRVAYPNGDVTAYVTVVYDAVVVGGTPAPDGDETIDVGWFTLEDLARLDVNPFTRAMLREVLGVEPIG